MRFHLTVLLSLLFLTVVSGLCPAEEFSWQKPHAKVLPNGDLEYTPKPFEFVAGDSVRYVDFESGADSNPGTKAEPWKHHPWDAGATGNAKAAADGPHTYVFKAGVTYRGTLTVPASAVGTAAEPIRLTRDPSWGDGPATINGAEVVTGWQQDAHADMPEANKVWSAEVDFLPRNVWITNDQGGVTRLKLARWPNWEITDPLDHMAEWPTWDNPQWWTGANKVAIDGKTRHIGIDNDLPKPLADLKDATVWTEWGIVMGSPYPTYVEAVVENKKGLAFTDTWAPGAGSQIITGNRYYLENLPKFLDEPGEFWVEKTGGNSAKLYIRLPGDANPDQVTIEAARHYNLISGAKAEHLHITGLTFRFGNIGWDYNNFVWAAENLEPAAIKIEGEGDGIVIANNTFEHIHMPVNIQVGGVQQSIGSVSITDNRIVDTDLGAIWVQNASPRGTSDIGYLGDVEVLRNHIENAGFRISRGAHGHAVDLRWPATSEMAGNFLNHIAGWGLSVFGGKGSGRQELTVPLSRQLIHHNRVEDVLLASNDWGGIETWQGGSHYIFNNVVINARGFKNWIFKPGDPTNIGGFGHAYYMDGSFKNYLFNNIGLGKNNELGTKGVNATAIQNIISFENWYFNNSFHKFAETTRQQGPNAGRRYYLGNVFSDTSKILFRHANPKDVAPDPNADHYSQAGAFFYDTIAYDANVIYGLKGRLGTFEETGVVYDSIEDFSEALGKVKAMVPDVGVITNQPPLVDPEAMNWQPAPGSIARDIDTLVFVPWALARPVGEWQFTLNRAKPSEIVDEAWFMTDAYDQRPNYYKETPRYPLVGQGIDASNFVEGPLANWTKTALQLNGDDEYLTIAAGALPTRDETAVVAGDDKTSEDDIVEAKLPFGTLRHPAKVTPGDSYKIYVDLDKPYPGQKLGMHIHWLKSGGWGGFSGVTFPHRLSSTRYVIDIKVKEHAGAVSYNWLPYLSPNGDWKDKTQNDTVSVGIAFDQATDDAPEGPWSVNILDSSMIIEAHLKTDDSDGVIASKMSDGVGYELALEGGELVFRVATDKGKSASAAIADLDIANGDWHHILAELDRKSRKLNLYVDASGASITVGLPEDFGSLGNSADFLVGGGPGKAHLAASFDFLRVTAASLAESKTTVEEIHAWQFNGPHFRDFADQDRREQNAAGALSR